MIKFVRLAAGQCFSQGTPVSSTNKTYRHDITEILLKVALNIIPPLKNVHTWVTCAFNGTVLKCKNGIRTHNFSPYDIFKLLPWVY
jgi:hypothetical protein